MERRHFLATSLAASCLPLTANLPQSAGQPVAASRQLLVWRRWNVQDDRQFELVDQFLKNALLPALARHSIAPIGAFTELNTEQEPSLYILVPFDRGDDFLTIDEQLAADSEFVAAAADYLDAPQDRPAYRRIDNRLLRAFSSVPKVQIPRQGERIFELRTYESHNEQKAMLKVEMFESAELAIFRDVRLDPVFFGTSLAGDNLPNLTYMLGYRDMQEREKNWKAFLSHPSWQTLKANPRYADTVSKIISVFLKPRDYSQV